MSETIPQFVLLNVFHHIPATDEKSEVYWAETSDRDGWLLYWPSNGDTDVTYRYPPDWY